MTQTTTPPTLQATLDGDPDLVDRIFEYLLAEVPAFAEAVTTESAARLKNAVRSEFSGDRVRVGSRTDAARRDLAMQVLTLFNGRNAREVARRLQISPGAGLTCPIRAGGRGGLSMIGYLGWMECL